MNWNNLKFAFSECFDEENYSFRSEGDNFIWAAPKEFLSIDNRDEFIHYELVKRGDLYFVEFHQCYYLIVPINKIICHQFLLQQVYS